MASHVEERFTMWSKHEGMETRANGKHSKGTEVARVLLLQRREQELGKYISIDDI